ncbi:MAG: PTS sugar transporter subunit IIA [Deferribacterota bacterium]|nr:PTS sugar transporter subunit IIA [Deferribacterota bacterium]
MIEFIIITHGSLALELLKTCEMIIGRQNKVHAITLQSNSSLQDIADKLNDIINNSKEGGVLIFTDMFGGSPSNIAMSYLTDDRVGVITGVNLPMLIRAFALRQELDSLSEISKKSVEAGKSSIRIARELFGYGKKDNL